MDWLSLSLEKGKREKWLNQLQFITHQMDVLYHIVFTPKYRRKAIYYKVREDLISIIRQLCLYKGVEIIEGYMMPDHIHMLVLIPPKLAISDFMGYLKSKSALIIFDKHAL